MPETLFTRGLLLKNQLIPTLTRQPFIKKLFSFWPVVLLSVLLCACSQMFVKSNAPVLAKELVLYNWVDSMPQTVLDNFEKEKGVKVIYKTYDSAEEATEAMLSGQVNFDVAVVDNDVLPNLITHKVLAEININNITNFKNISPGFRDLAFDPGNKHSLPNSYGTTGLLVRSDLLKKPVTRWADLWDESLAGKIAVRSQPTELISVALRSLGYPLNSEDPAQLQAARDQLLVLKNRVRFMDTGTQEFLQPLLDGEVFILVAWNGDAKEARDRNPAVTYVLPEEGTLLWGDSFVISANSPNKTTAEVFINYLLQPEVNAEMVKAYFYPTTNDGAFNFLPAEIIKDPLIYPSQKILSKNNFYLPLSPAGKELYQSVWQEVMGSQ
jgi:spermidine/putrescine transport system substrate-binding protein